MPSWGILLAQDVVKADWVDKVLASGPTGALTFAFAALIAAVAYVVWKYGPRVAISHDKLVNIAAETACSNSQSLKTLTETVGIKMDPKGDAKYDTHSFSTVGTNGAISYLAQAMKCVLAGHPACDEATQHIDSAIKILRKSARNPDSDVYPAN